MDKISNNLLAGNPFGTVNPPPGVSAFLGGNVRGVSILINILIRTMIVGAAIYAIFNLITAGYGFISAGGDPKRIQDATSKIWQSLIGLTVAAGSLVIAGIVGRLLFGNVNAILNVTIFTP